MNNDFEKFSLTESQKGIFFECIENPGSTAYNIPFEVYLPKTIDADKLEQAVKKVAVLHPSLFVSIRTENGEPVMIKGNAECTVLRTHGDIETAKNNFVRPFDVLNDVLYRFEICTDGNASIFFLDVHHIVFDGTSLNIFLNQVADCYNGKEIKGESRDIFEISALEKNLMQSDEYKDAQEFFDNMLSSRELDCDLISDRKDKVRGTGKLIMDSPVSISDVEKFSKKNRITAATVFTAAFCCAMSAFAGTDEPCITTVSSGRHCVNLPDAVGMFVKTLPLCVDIHREDNVTDFLQNFHKIFHGAVNHECISFGELASKYGVKENVSFVYQSSLLSEINLGGTCVLPEMLAASECPSDILCMLLKTADGYKMQTFYNKELYSEELVQSISESVYEIVGGMISKEKLCDIDLVCDRQKKFIDSVNATETEFDKTETVNSVFEKTIKKYSEKTALVYKERRYTYSEFDKVTKKIASYVTSLGILPDEFVAVLAPRNDEAVISAWGVIRSGSAFQILDSAYPADRINYMLSDSKARLLIADRNLMNLIDGYDGKVLYTDEISALPECDVIRTDVKPENAITMIYTSGTTGKPKGCVLENRNLVAFFRNHTKIMEINENSRIASYASFGFDAGIMDIITALTAGAELYIVPDEIRLDMGAVEKFYIDNEITHGFMTTQVGRMFAESTKCKTLKSFMVGGEKLVPFKVQDGFRFINGYGPCETMAYVCHYDVTDNSLIQPVGKPSGNIKVYVSDKYGRMMPLGAVGELCISGAQVGRGYLGLPEKTAEAFVKNPYTSADGYERMYKTGDIVRQLPDGNIEFVGRRDGQVKIRGYRCELTEIEEVIRRFDGVSDATVTAFDEIGGGKYIAAYVVSKDKIDIEALHSFIGSEKPDYMVPKVTVQIDKIPYNQNQKVNKKALPVPEIKQSEDELEKPETELQKKIFDIAARVLGNDSFGINSDLFRYGLTSIGLLRLNSLISDELEINIGISDIRKNSTVKALAKFAEKYNTQESFLEMEDYPIMSNQTGVYLESIKNKDSLIYNVPVLFKISSDIDVKKLKASVESAINAHPYIKATIKTDNNGDVRIVRNDNAQPNVEVIEADELPSAEKLMRVFDIFAGGLYRAEIYVTAKEKYLFFDFHHIISDGTSIAVLLRDINLSFEGKAVESEQFTGFDEALAQESQSAEKIEEGREYFNSLLNGCNSECLPAPCPESKIGEFVCEISDCSDKITAYCNKNNVSLNAFFNAVFGFTLSKFLHSDDVTYCTVYNGRNNARLAQSFAMLVKTLPVRCAVNTDMTVASLVSDMQNQLLDTMSNDVVPFSEISEKYGIRPDIFFNYQGDSFIFDNIGGEKAEMQSIDILPAKSPISIEVFLDNGKFTIKLCYRKDKYCEEFASSLIESIATAAKNFTAKEKLCEVSILSKNEKAHFDIMNDTDTPFERIAAHRVFEKYAKAFPDKIAVKDINTSITYSQLDKMANSIANHLVSLGAKKGEIIALICERSVLVPVAQIGIMKAGCAFLPMIPSYPDDRIEYCIKDAGCKFALLDGKIIDAKKSALGDCKPLAVEKLTEGASTDSCGVEVELNQLAYCIYTSGSTGTPKGVMVEHHNLTDYVQTSGLKTVANVASTAIAMSSISFDMSLSEIFLSLCSENTVYIASEEEIHDFGKLLSAFENNDIDSAIMTPTFAWNLLSLREFEKPMSKIKGIVLGAEAFPPALFGKLKALNPDMIIQNGYGPTECTQSCSAKVVTQGENITIGSPYANTKYYVIDECGNLLPRYACGELMICGELVCRGYVNLPEKNKASFTEIDGVRAYHSGDLVRINRDNEAEFSGRCDNQVKLRGFRVELDEIENVMQEFDTVKQSKVIVRNNGTEDYLCGFFTATSEIDIDGLTAFMKSKLTNYMIPSALMQLETMPITPNGKIDKKALPEITVKKKKRGLRKPKKSLEEKITELFKSVLNIDECYVDDNFFEIGGTSLSASKAVMQLKSDGYKAEYQDIFDHQSAVELAEYLESISKPATTYAVERNDGVDEDDEILELLKYNRIDFAKDVERTPLGDVLLTGACGFLGVHILKTLLEIESGKIICLMSKGRYDDIASRLQATLVYYFENDYKEEFGKRIEVIEGDITDDNLNSIFENVHFDTVINCAACVKHYANDDSIEFVNVHGVEKLIELTKKKQAKMIQISTTSVPGAHTPQTYSNNLKMPENRFFVIDDMNNQYGQSKYKAELKIFDAIKNGMKGKVIRVGNLMGRYSDGEFQTNMHTNAFLNALRGFVTIGKCPISHSTDPMSFSPIDCTAKAVVLLSGTNDMFTVFHADSRFTFDEMKLIDTINRCGITVTPIPDEEYYAEFYRMMGDSEKNSKISALLTNDRPDMHMVETDNRFTANVLYRLGFAWPFIDDTYLEKVIMSLDTLDFFYSDDYNEN